MADLTTYRNWTVPEEYSDPWYTEFVSLMNEVDSDVNALYKRLNIFDTIGSVSSPGQLRLNSGIVGSMALVKGFWEEGDEGGGIFYWVVGSASDDGGTIIVPSGSSGYWKRLQTSDVVNIRWFGAKGSSGTDDTAAIHAAIQSGAQAIFIPEGTFYCNIQVSGKANLIGSGPFSKLRAYSTSTAVITVLERITGAKPGRSMKDFAIDGRNADDSFRTMGIQYSYIEVEADIENLYIRYCTRGISSTYGPIGNFIRYCSFADCDYGIYFKGTVAVNLNIIKGCRFDDIEKCAVYLNGPGGGNELANNWMESIKGFGAIFRSADSEPNRIYGGWFENIASEATVTLDDEGTVQPYYVWVDSGNFVCTGGQLPGVSLFEDCHVTMDYHWGKTTAAELETSNADVVIRNAKMDRFTGTTLIGSANSSMIVENPRTYGYAKRGFICESKPAFVNVSDVDNLASDPTNNYAPRHDVVFGDVTVTTLSETFGGTGIIRISKIANTNYFGTSLGDCTAGKAYAYSFSMRSAVATNQEVPFAITGNGQLFRTATRSLNARVNRWSHYCGVVVASDPCTSQTTRFGTSVAADFDLTRLQFVEFDTLNEAHAFIDSLVFGL